MSSARDAKGAEIYNFFFWTHILCWKSFSFFTWLHLHFVCGFSLPKSHTDERVWLLSPSLLWVCYKDENFQIYAQNRVKYRKEQYCLYHVTFIGANAFLSQNKYSWSDLQVTKAWQIDSSQLERLEITLKRLPSPRQHNKWVQVCITHPLNML